MVSDDDVNKFFSSSVTRCGECGQDVITGGEVSASGSNDLLYAIRDARNELYKASNEKCTCTGFVLQYEGGCQCERGKKIAACEHAMWRLIESI